jgi:hypothetical protein
MKIFNFTIVLSLLATFANFAASREIDVTVTGKCTGSSGATYKLELSDEDNGRIDIEFDVYTALRNKAWNVVFQQNGKQVLNTSKRTGTTRGSFEVEKEVAGKIGDVVTVKATSTTTNDVCTATATFK